jgi:hypothetical protein
MFAIIYGESGSGLSWTAAALTKQHPVIVFASPYVQQHSLHRYHGAVTYYEYSQSKLNAVINEQKTNLTMLQIVFDEINVEDEAISMLARVFKKYNIRVVYIRHTDKCVSLELKRCASKEIFTDLRTMRQYFRRSSNSVDKYRTRADEIADGTQSWVKIAFCRQGGRMKLLNIHTDIVDL